MREGFVRTTTGMCAAALLLSAAPVAAQETFSVPGDRVAIYNLAGQVEVVAGRGSDVIVSVVRGGADARGLEIEVDEIRGRNTLRVIYPEDDVVYSGSGRGRFTTNLQVRDDGTWDGDGRRVRVRSGGRGMEAWADLRIEVPAGKDVAVYLAAGQADAQGIRGDLRLDLHSGHASARDVTGSLLVDTGSGSVEVADVEGEVEVDTGSGSVTIDRVRGPRVTVDTGSGGVSGSGIESERLLVDTGSGGIRLTGVAAADAEFDTGSGSVELDFLRTVDRLIVDTGSGGVTVSLPEGLDADVELDTGSGRIEVDFPLEVRSMRRDHVEGRIGAGRGLIRIDTGSGSIRLRRN
jgi:hypothetical protein